MKLLIVTQAVDSTDPILGFFHRWLEAFSKHWESIEVVCLKEGVHHLPENVHVHSLGKEKGRRSRLAYMVRFGYLIWRLRSRYDRVLVHMNPEYMIMGGIDWRVMGKPAALWYNHPKKDWRFWVATHLARRIFHTSPYAAPASLPHALRMPAGIDTEIFKPQPVLRTPYSLYMQGRIMSSKNIVVACRALRLTRAFFPTATLTLVGPEEAVYGQELRKEFADLIESGALMFVGSKPNLETPNLYSTHAASINLASDGHYDKAVLESLATETPVIVWSKAFGELVPGAWVIPQCTPENLFTATKTLFELSPAESTARAQRAREAVVAQESLLILVKKLKEELVNL